jgi:hypothetical protein
MASSSSTPESRALANGVMSLNSVFVVRNKKRRLFKRSTIRLSLAEMVWIAISTLGLGLIIFGVIRGVSGIPGLRSVISYYLMILAPIGGFIIGRQIARTSPYRRYSGEGLNEYLWVQRDKIGKEVGRVFGRGVSITRSMATVDGRKIPVNCVEWLGTSRATSMPRPVNKFYSPSRNEKADFVYLSLVPRTEATNWSKRYQQKRARNWE